MPGFPRRIAQDFHGPPTAKKPNGRTIPNNIDTVYFDKRDENLYFFKGKKVNILHHYFEKVAKEVSLHAKTMIACVNDSWFLVLCDSQ